MSKVSANQGEQKAQERVTQEFVALLSILFDGTGLRRSTGEIMGLLFAQDTPLSLSQIGAELNLSKATVSVGVRELLGYGVVRRVWEPGSRGDLYRLEDDLVGSAKEFFITMILSGVEPCVQRLETIDRIVKDEISAGKLPKDEARFLTQRKKTLREARKKVRTLRFLFSKISG